MLTKGLALVSAQKLQAVKQIETAVETTQVKPLEDGQLYVASGDQSNSLVGAYLVNNGEFIDTDTHLSEAKARQQASSTPKPVYDVRSGVRHTYKAPTWTATVNALWSDYLPGLFLHNPTTKRTFYSQDNTVMKVSL